MRTNFLPVMLALALLGCASPEQDIQRAAGICTAGGIASGGPQFQDCVSAEVQKMGDARGQAGAAIAAGLQSYGQSQSTYQPAYRAPIRCTSNPVGAYIYTTCN